MSNIKLRWLKPADTDLAEIAAELNGPTWAVSRHEFTADTLKDFLGRDDRFYLLGYLDDQIAGAIHGYLYLHPTGVHYVWIDEVDVSEPMRRRGVGKAMMQAVLEWTKEKGADEAWLGTEDDNEAALALYKSLKPTETENEPTFSWRMND